MKKFRYSLQTPLDVAVGEEKALKQRLVALRNTIRRLELERSDMEKARKHAQDRLGEDIAACVTANELKIYQNHLYKLKADIDGINRRIAEALIDANNRIKTLEKIKEDRFRSFLYEVEREESKQLEDFLNGKAVIA
jgi:flagellar export protein FliJ